MQNKIFLTQIFTEFNFYLEKTKAELVKLKLDQIFLSFWKMNEVKDERQGMGKDEKTNGRWVMSGKKQVACKKSKMYRLFIFLKILTRVFIVK